MKNKLIYLLVLCFALSLLVFGLHHHAEGEIDDATGHIGLYTSPAQGQTVLSAISGDATGHTGFYVSPLSSFIPPDSPQIATSASKVLLIFLEDTSVPASLSRHTFLNRAPPVL